jgi:hypothetical protein
MKAFKYVTPFILYVLSLLAFQGEGLICYAPLLYTFFAIPFLELFIKRIQGKTLVEFVKGEININCYCYRFITLNDCNFQFVNINSED